MTDIERLIEDLTLAEKVDLVSGASAWRSNPIARLGIPPLKMSDGPNGVRGDGRGDARSTAFPVGTCLAATFDTALLEELGTAIGIEARDKRVDVVLGPTINIHRTPLGGRNFECYSEDPLLSGRLASAFVRGVQARGVAACLKHFVCNDSEFERHSISVDVDERPLREIYLRPFEMAVKSARPWSVMAAYNRINGVFACSHDALVNGVLKGEWGFDGYVVSDWFAALETVDNALGGLDMEMPGPPQTWGSALLDAVESGAVPEQVLDDKVRRILTTLERTGKFADPEDRPEQHIDRPEHRALARRLAARGMVLLRNENRLLPLATADIHRLAVIGPNAEVPQIMGGGSSQVTPHRVSTPLEALRARFGPEVEVTFEPGAVIHKYVPSPPPNVLTSSEGEASPGLSVTTWPNREFAGEPTWQRVISRAQLVFTMLNGDAAASDLSARAEGVVRPTESGTWTFGLSAAGRARLYVDDALLVDNWSDPQPGDLMFGNGSAEVRGQLDLEAGKGYRLRIEYVNEPGVRFQGLRYGIEPPVPDDLMARAVDAANSADAVVLVAGTNRDWETEGNDRESLDLPGAQNRLIAEVCAANPNTVVVLNTGAPVAMPWLDRAPAILQAWFAGQEFGEALCDVLLGDVSPSGRLPTTFPRRLQDTPAFGNYPGEFGHVRYGEGLLVGYRWYDARDIAPLFPFGHGLSYTEFEYGEARATGTPGHDFAVDLEIANVGERPGIEVVQAYVTPASGAAMRPPKELKAVTTIELAPGERARARLEFDAEAFAYWDPKRHAWASEPGSYRVLIGASSRDIRSELTVQIDEAQSPAALSP